MVMLFSAATRNGMPTLAARRQRKVRMEEEEEQIIMAVIVSCVPCYDVLMRSLLETVVDLSRVL